MFYRKRFIAFIMILTIILSGAAGFGGTYIASMLTAPINSDVDINNQNTETKIGDLHHDDYIGEIVNPANEEPEIKQLNMNIVPAKRKVMTTPEIAEFASKSVVEIYTETVSGNSRLGQFISEGAGSGVIISPDGYIVTNNHVIENARKITVRLNSGEEYEAELIGRDSKTDLAVLKINAANLHPAVFGNSNDLVIGEPAIAIGNPLGKLGGTVSEGIISAPGRNIEIDGHTMNLLQTTAAINPGNSGGGLFNEKGELIGVVNAKSTGSGIEGLGFAIPINTVKVIIEELMQYGFIPGRIDFGASLIEIQDTVTAMMYRVQSLGVYVSGIDHKGIALQPGDRIINIGGTEITSIADINELLTSHTVGDVLEIDVVRNNTVITVEHTLKQAMY